VKLGFFGIGSGPCADPAVAVRVARAAEDAGLESLWTGEHVVLPDPRVPPSPAPPDFPMLHPSTALAYLAAHTERVRLGTGIVILPQRNPLVLAKELASLDVLSRGRLIFGVGAGYLRPEFDALGVPFERRGARTDEYIDAIRALWTQERPSFAGRFVSFAGVQARPRPVQQPPPIAIGGRSPAAFERAVRRGDGWYGFFVDLDATRRCVAGLREAAKRVERPAALGALEISVTPPPGPLSRDTLRRYADLGVQRVIGMSLEREGDALVRFVSELGRALGGGGLVEDR
jgi:probable F420-dependent oxidoreductase